METRTVEQVESWQTRPFTDGFAGLRELSDGEFSGAVRAGGAWLFMLNGRIIGVYEGSLDDFGDADGTAYAAPHPSLPLLFSMQEQGGQTQAKYYTNDTPLSEVDSTLSQGSFTGYVELSENVLSGDYYVAYYGGRSMSVAFVGASEQVLTGDEAFERADDEVGIYEVRDVDVEVTDVPEPDVPEDSSATAGGRTSPAESPARTVEADSGDDAPESSRPTDAGGPPGATGPDASGSDAGAGTSGSSAAAPPRDGTTGDTGPSGDESDDRTPSGAATDGRSAPNESASGQSAGQPASDSAERSATPDRDGRTPDAGSAERAADASSAADASATTDASSTAGSQSASRPGAAREASSGTDAPSDGGSDASDEEAATEDVFEKEDEWRETTTIPSLDPDRSESPRETADGESAGGGAAGDRSGAGSAGRSRTSPRAGGQASKSAGSTGEASASASRTASGASGASGGPAASGESSSGTSSSDGAGTPDETGGKVQDRVRELRTQLEQRKEQVERLKERLSTLESERNEYKRERDALRQEVERLEAKLGSDGSAGSASGRQLGRGQAFAGTNLFVRYQSKGQATLAEAAAGEADPEDVNANLRLEHHTQFEADDVTVAGDSFEAFLTDSFEYRFVSWVVEHLLYEIRDTGHRDRLRDLYEAIPKVDRVDLHGSVDAGGDDGDARQESFDVVMRDKMGNPLVVADLNGSRDPTTGEMMGSLVDASTDVAETHDELAGAFQVTESFFEPAALETAESATSGGFLSREKRESFVKLSRKRGYHLCLVESRSGGFHLNVPEL